MVALSSGIPKATKAETKPAPAEPAIAPLFPVINPILKNEY